jgi:hypothetical protein
MFWNQKWKKVMDEEEKRIGSSHIEGSTGG